MQSEFATVPLCCHSGWHHLYWHIKSPLQLFQTLILLISMPHVQSEQIITDRFANDTHVRTAAKLPFQNACERTISAALSVHFD